jgi:hypothetical protein
MECCCSLLAACFAIAIVIFFLARHYLEKLVLPNLEKRHVFVTGCDSGFGHLLALQLAAHQIPVYAGCFTYKVLIDLLTKAVAYRKTKGVVSVERAV